MVGKSKGNKQENKNAAKEKNQILVKIKSWQKPEIN
jgi:hypothetical protein